MEEPQQFLLFKVKLLNLDSCACLFELSLSSLSVVSRNLLLNSLGSAVNELLSFLQAKAGDLTDSLDDVDLSSAGRSKDNVELGLLLSSSSAASAGAATATAAAAETPYLSSTAETSSESSITVRVSRVSKMLVIFSFAILNYLQLVS